MSMCTLARREVLSFHHNLTRIGPKKAKLCDGKFLPKVGKKQYRKTPGLSFGKSLSALCCRLHSGEGNDSSSSVGWLGGGGRVDTDETH